MDQSNNDTTVPSMPKPSKNNTVLGFVPLFGLAYLIYNDVIKKQSIKRSVKQLILVTQVVFVGLLLVGLFVWSNRSSKTSNEGSTGSLVAPVDPLGGKSIDSFSCIAPDEYNIFGKFNSTPLAKYGETQYGYNIIFDKPLQLKVQDILPKEDLDKLDALAEFEKSYTERNYTLAMYGLVDKDLSAEQKVELTKNTYKTVDQISSYLLSKGYAPSRLRQNLPLEVGKGDIPADQVSQLEATLKTIFIRITPGSGCS